MSRYGRGYRADPRDHRTSNFRAHPLARHYSGQIPDQFKVAPAPVMDQSLTGECTAHGAAVCLYGALGFIISQQDLYGVTRALQRSDDGLPLDTPLVDVGCAPNEVVRASALFGVRPMLPANDDQKSRNSDADPATVNAEPNLYGLERDATHVLIGQYAVTTSDAAKVALLTTKKPLTIAFFVDTVGPRSVEQWDPATGPLGAPDMSDPNGGGHQTALLGWRKDGRGRDIWYLQNSWSKDWGMAGFFEGDPDFMAGASDMFAWDVHIVRPA